MRTALIVVIFVGVVAATTAQAVPPYTPAIYPTEAGFLRAIAPYQQALAVNPKDADASYNLGVAYWETYELNFTGVIPYGADYLDKTITTMEQTVANDDKRIGAWAILLEAYYTRQAPGDEEKKDAATGKFLQLASDISVTDRGMPPTIAVSGIVPGPGQVIPPGTPPPGPGVGPTPPGKFNPADFYVIGDPDTKLIYKYSCATLPPIQHPTFFLTKWEALNRGYKAAEICTP